MTWSRCLHRFDDRSLCVVERKGNSPYCAAHDEYWRAITRSGWADPLRHADFGPVRRMLARFIFPDPNRAKR
jgi:hypothetical protein